MTPWQKLRLLAVLLSAVALLPTLAVAQVEEARVRIDGMV